MTSLIRIGISGWRYKPWRGTFYPKGLPQRDELRFAGEQFSTLEINGSFYSLQRPELYRAWHACVGPNFIFSVKGPRFITHLKRLKEIEVPLANFFASGVLALEEKLGPCLWQFPAQLRFNVGRFREFFELLPRTTKEAARFARRHDERLNGRSLCAVRKDRPLRHAVEIRHESFLVPEFVDLLKRFNVSLVVTDGAGKWPIVEEVTSDFLYLRLHGAEELYVSGYTDEALEYWAERVSTWASGSEPADARKVTRRTLRQRRNRDVYVYFDNDAKVKAPFDAYKLVGLVENRESNAQGGLLRQRRSSG